MYTSLTDLLSSEDGSTVHPRNFVPINLSPSHNISEKLVSVLIIIIIIIIIIY
jgi:hypothetical protein